MFEKDLPLLCCPRTGEALRIKSIASRDVDGEIIEGELVSTQTNHSYVIFNGIPRFVMDKEYNISWEYKWTNIDAGKGINYRIADKSDNAYKGHDIYDRNNHKGKAYEHVRGKVVLDIGCGVGQYSFRMLEEFEPAKLIALDLTGGVDIFRKIMLERFPKHKSKILFVQASVFEMPFRDETFDYVFSLGVLHHTGRTCEAITQAARVLKYGGQLNFWIYASESVPFSAREPGRMGVRSFWTWIILFSRYVIIKLWMTAFRKMRHENAVAIVRFFSSEFWYKIIVLKIPIVSLFARFVFDSVKDPDFDYRFINNYDGWINAWDETWDEAEIFPALRESKIAIQGISEWRLGIWGIKLKDFYQ